MNYRVVQCIIVFISLLPLFGESQFKLVEQWKHEEEIFGRIKLSTIDKDGHLLIGFYKNGLRYVTPEIMKAFAPFGEGPNEVMGFKAFVPYKGDIGILEGWDKMKVFTKKENTYVAAETLWFKRGKYPHLVTGGVFADNKWFFSGDCQLNYNEKLFKKCFIKVYDESRKPLKLMLKQEKTNRDKFYLMNFYIVNHKDRLFFMAENQLTVTTISIKDLTVQDKVNLHIPGFYKKMPTDFYQYKKDKRKEENFLKSLEKWITGYSRISQVLVEDKHLVVQIRVFDETLKKFCLLFYNIDSLKFEKEVFVDDYLLAARQGKYYFYANGNPTLDEGTDKCGINIYHFDQSK